MLPRHLHAVVALSVLLAGCGGDGADEPRADAPSTAPSSSTEPSSPATEPAPEPSGAPPEVRATKVADFDAPLALAVRGGDDALYVAEKNGRVKALRNGRAEHSPPVLDVSGLVSRGSEQGLLGIAFSPDGGHLYVNYTNVDGDTRVVEYAFTDGRAVPASARVLLAVDQPFANHNGGQLAFGPDGLLYIGLGDGGGGGDPQGNAQRLDTLLGKILRIDPAPSGGRAYTVPADNPFASRAGARPEIWALGLRNPWRFSFDRETGALWIGDVGQGDREEISAAEAGSRGGENYGWDRYEGTRRFAGGATDGLVFPVYDYATANGNCAVTGGYVYRGERIAGLRGRYLFGDFCKGDVLVLVEREGGMEAVALGPQVESLASFGEDGSGEVYALSLTSGLYRFDPA